MDDPGAGSQHCVPGGQPGVTALLHLSPAPPPRQVRPQVYSSLEIWNRRNLRMFRRFERKLLVVGGTLNMTASLFMLTALLVNVFLDCKVSLASMSDPIYKLIHFSPVRFSPPTAGAETTSCTPTTTTSPGATPRASSLSSPPPSQPGPISRCDWDGQIK